MESPLADLDKEHGDGDVSEQQGRPGHGVRWQQGDGILHEQHGDMEAPSTDLHKEHSGGDVPEQHG